MKPRCFKCEKVICPNTEKYSDEDAWRMPLDAVLFSGGGSYGSRIYDTLMDGIGVDIVVCDDCLKKARGTWLMREVVRDRDSRAARVKRDGYRPLSDPVRVVEGG